MYAYNLEKLKVPKIEEVRSVIKAINKQHTTSGTYEGRLSDEEALSDYQQLIEALPSIPVAQSCPTLSDHMHCSLPDSSIHGIFQARLFTTE